MSDLSNMSYAELLAALRKDLQLDATTDVLPGSVLASLVDRNGFAAFLQLLSAQRLQLAYGSVQVTWAGGTQLSPVATVPHHIGRTPVFVAGLARDIGVIAAAFCVENQPPDATNVYLQLLDPFGNPGGGQNQRLWWAALG